MPIHSKNASMKASGPTASYTQPASGSNVTVSVGSTSWMAAGQVLFVTTGGFYTVSSITNSTTVVLTNLGYIGNASSGTVVASSKTVSAGGLIGPTGAAGATGSAGPTGTTGSVPQGYTSMTGITAGLANSTRYFAVNQYGSDNANESAADSPAPADITLTGIICGMNNAPGSGKTRTFTVRDNAADTSMTCTISDTAKACSLFPASGLAITAGHMIDWQGQTTGSPAATDVTCVMYFHI